MELHSANPGPWTGEGEPSPVALGPPDEDWKHELGFDEAQHLSGSAQPVSHHLVTQTSAPGKPPGQVVRTKLQMACAPSMAIAGAELSQLAPKGLLVKQPSAATRLRGERKNKMWSERMVDCE